MAEPYKPLKVKTATFATQALKGAQSFSRQWEGSEQSIRGDGVVGIQQAWIEGLGLIITVTCIEGSLNSALQIPGTVGSLVIVTFAAASGRGAQAASDKTFTYAKALCLPPQSGHPLDGVPTVNYRWRVYDEAGDVTQMEVVS